MVMIPLDLTDRVKDAAFSAELDYVGIAPVERFANAPEGWRPGDLLKDCRSVVVMAIKIGEGVREANKLAQQGLRHGIYSYMTFGYIFLNEKLNLGAFRVARLLEKGGYRSLPIHASPPFDPYMNRGAFSHRHAAVAAGLGEFGWNTLLVTPDWGPRIRLASVLTQAKLEPDPMYSGGQICKRERCDVCVNVCPVKAIHPRESVKLEIGERSFEYAKLSVWRCKFGTHGFTKKALGRKEIPMPENPTPEDYLETVKLEDPWQKAERLASFCGRCIINCPIPEL